MLSLNAGFIITKHPLFVKPFFHFSEKILSTHHIVLDLTHSPQHIGVLAMFSRKSGSIFFVKKQVFCQKNQTRNRENTGNCERNGVYGTGLFECGCEIDLLCAQNQPADAAEQARRHAARSQIFPRSHADGSQHIQILCGDAQSSKADRHALDEHLSRKAPGGELRKAGG